MVCGFSVLKYLTFSIHKKHYWCFWIWYLMWFFILNGLESSVCFTCHHCIGSIRVLMTGMSKFICFRWFPYSFAVSHRPHYAPLSKEWPQPPKSGKYLIEEKITVFLGKVFRTLPTAHLIQGYCFIQCHLIRSVYMMGQCYLIHAHSYANCVCHFMMVCSRFCDS